MDELVKLIPSVKFRMVTHSNLNDEIRSFYVYTFVTKLKGIPGNLKVTVVKGSWNEDDPEKVHVLVTNHIGLSAEEILEKYLLRWGIECIFRDLRDNLAFDHYQVRSINSITRHWSKFILAQSCTCYNLQTIGDTLNVYRKLNTISSLEWIKKNPRKFKQKFGLSDDLLRAA